MMPGTTSTSHEIDFHSGALALRGTLTVPAGEGPFPAALLVPGSGPVDRDSNHPKLPLGVTGRLATALADAGIASLRYDKRGVGDSSGDFWTAGLHDNIADARVALEQLRDDDVVDAGAVVVIGHSEGAFIATALGATALGATALGATALGATALGATAPGATAPGESVEADIAGLALLSGTARSGEATTQWQVDAVVPTLPRPVRAVIRLLRIDLRRKQAATHRRLRQSTADSTRIGLQRYNARWWREFLDFDPAPLLRRVQAPVLAVTGDKDLQTPAEDVTRIGELVAGPFEGQVVPDVNHILRHEPGRPNLRGYKAQSRTGLDPRVVEKVTAWCRAVTGEQADIEH